MDLSIFSNGLTTKAYQDATKKRSAKRRTNKDWLKSNKEKLSDMTKQTVLNNIVRNNQTTIDGKSYFFRLLGVLTGFLKSTDVLEMKVFQPNTILNLRCLNCTWHIVPPRM